jgi:hypothetical protein
MDYNAIGWTTKNSKIDLTWQNTNYRSIGDNNKTPTKEKKLYVTNGIIEHFNSARPNMLIDTHCPHIVCVFGDWCKPSNSNMKNTSTKL